jgi:hypothetical protein
MYYRMASSKNPMSDWGHAMFANSMANISNNYGDTLYTFDGYESIKIEDLSDVIIEAHRNNPLTNNGWEISEDEIVAIFNPDDIVNGAGGWDDGDAFTWFWENVGDKLDLKAVLTNDGAIVFDESLIK